MTCAFVLLIWCLTSLVMPTGLTHGQKGNSDSGRSERVFIQGPGFAGVIFPADMKAFQSHFPKGTQYWTPSKSDVLAAEHELVSYLRDSKNPQVRESRTQGRPILRDEGCTELGRGNTPGRIRRWLKCFNASKIFSLPAVLRTLLPGS